MADINNDLILLDQTMEGEGTNNRWNHIFPRTTENVKRVLEQVNLEGKEVWTVLSSSDIYFSLLTQKTKRIKTFDINPLTYRYYYLRKWMLEYGVIDGRDCEYDEICKIINAKREYICEDEEESVRLWNKYLSRLNKDLFNLYNARLFEYVTSRKDCPYDEKVNLLAEYLKKVPLEFELLDIGEPGVGVDDSYDVVYLSNVMDLDLCDPKIVRDNLYRILKDEGYAICTNLLTHPYFDFYKTQRRVFDEKFICEEMFTETVNYDTTRYYRYIKR